jgi:hypothetical protein
MERELKMAEEKYHKVVFRLEQDEEGYPPSNWESLWALETEDGLFSIDNIPFFVKGISSGDVVAAEQSEGELRFKELVRPSSNSVFRLYVSDVSEVPSARERLSALGCESEQSHIPKLIAVEIPGSVPIQPVASFFDTGAESGLWEYEEGVLRHPIPR